MNLQELCRERLGRQHCRAGAIRRYLFQGTGGKGVPPLPTFTPMDTHDAELELARRYFTHYAPATLRDAAYFFHVSQTQVKRWLKDLPVTSFSLEGREYFHIPTPVPQQDVPDCLLLAGFDPLLLGYRKEDHPILPPEHLRKVFTLSGIVHPTILLKGRIVGRWKQKDGRLSLCLFESIDTRDKRHIVVCAEQLWPLRSVDFTPAD